MAGEDISFNKYIHTNNLESEINHLLLRDCFNYICKTKVP